MGVAIIFMLLFFVDIISDLSDSIDEAQKMHENSLRIINSTATIAFEIAKAKLRYDAIKFGAKIGSKLFIGYNLGKAGYKAGSAITNNVKKKRAMSTEVINNKVRSGMIKLRQ